VRTTGKTERRTDETATEQTRETAALPVVVVVAAAAETEQSESERRRRAVDTD
jgi:hypothetical protein